MNSEADFFPDDRLPGHYMLNVPDDGWIHYPSEHPPERGAWYRIYRDECLKSTVRCIVGNTIRPVFQDQLGRLFQLVLEPTPSPMTLKSRMERAG